LDARLNVSRYLNDFHVIGFSLLLCRPSSLDKKGYAQLMPDHVSTRVFGVAGLVDSG
jgi:hypothetical protein